MSLWKFDWFHLLRRWVGYVMGGYLDGTLGVKHDLPVFGRQRDSADYGVLGVCWTVLNNTGVFGVFGITQRRHRL